MGKKIIVAGYYGCGNLGDDAILLGFLEGMQKAGVAVEVMSGAPEETNRLYGVPAFDRRDSKQFAAEMQTADALVFAGGSIFQDVSSTRSVFYYSNLVKTAKSAKKKVIMLGQGVGPLTSFLGKSAARSAFNAADVIAVRDPASVTSLKELGFKGMPRVTGDMAFLLPQIKQEDSMSQEYGMANMKTVGISARPFKGIDVVKIFGELARQLFAAGYLPVLIEMDREADGPLIMELDKVMGGKVPSMRRLPNPMQYQQRVRRMDSVIAMRLHAGILAAMVGVPTVMVSYDPKVTAMAKQLDLPTPVAFTKEVTAQRIFDNFQQAMRTRDTWVKSMERKVVEQRKAAELNIELLMSAL